MTHFVSWDDPGNTWRRFGDGGQGKLYLTGFAGTSLTFDHGDLNSDPNILGHPPIHVHHAHLNVVENPYRIGTHTTLWSMLKMGAMALCVNWRDPAAGFMTLIRSYNADIGYIHGDSVCFEEEGGEGCLIQRWGRGRNATSNITAASGKGGKGVAPEPTYGTAFERPLYLDANLNDVRAPGQCPPEQVGLIVSPKSTSERKQR